MERENLRTLTIEVWLEGDDEKVKFLSHGLRAYEVIGLLSMLKDKIKNDAVKKLKTKKRKSW